jgi:hypothetical protein
MQLREKKTYQCTYAELTGQDCPQTAIHPMGDPMRRYRVQGGEPVPLMSPKKQRRREEIAARTPEQQATHEKRAARINAVQAFLMTRLFGWSSPELFADGLGKECPAKDALYVGQTRFRKGWFGIPPGATEPEYMANLGGGVSESRHVVKAMHAKGYAFSEMLIPESEEWTIAFFSDSGYYVVEDADEALGIAECAKKALEGVDSTTAKKPRTQKKAGE